MNKSSIFTLTLLTVLTCNILSAADPDEGMRTHVRGVIAEEADKAHPANTFLIEMAGWEDPDLEFAQELLNTHATANATYHGGVYGNPNTTALASTSGNRHKASVELWQEPASAQETLNTHATANATYHGGTYGNPDSATALTKAAGNGQTAYVTLLLDNGANIEIKDPWDNRTALMAAAFRGRNETLELLIARGANVNAQNCIKTTALMWAADRAHTESVKKLLAAGADVTLKDNDGKTALSKAKQNQRVSPYDARYNEIIDLLTQAGKDKLQRKA